MTENRDGRSATPDIKIKKPVSGGPGLAGSGQTTPRRAGPEEPLLPPPGMLGALNPTYRIKRRQLKIIEEIQRNREGGHKVPTWVLALILVLFIGAWALLVILS